MHPHARGRVRRTATRAREYNYNWFANDLEEPYTTPDDKPFSWQGRMRVVGGRTNVWGRQSYRFSEQDLKGKSFDGYGDDWPLGYKDLAPYYDLVEDYVGISGQAENVPELPDSKFHPAMPMTLRGDAAADARQGEARPHGHDRPDGQHHQADQRPRAVPLLRPVRARLRHALVLQLRVHDRRRRARRPATARSSPNAMVYKVLMDPDDQKATRRASTSIASRARRRRSRAEVVILCAQALESTRILLNSSTPQYPNGLAQLQRRARPLPDGSHCGWPAARAASSRMPGAEAVDGARRAGRPGSTRSASATRSTARARKDFMRGYGFQGGGSPTSTWARPASATAFKKAVMNPVNSVGLVGFGECCRASTTSSRSIRPARRRVRHPGAARSRCRGARTRRR